MKQDVMQEIKKLVNNSDVLDRFYYLQQRWQDESEYEDFNDFVEAMMVCMPEGATLIKGTKRPFGVVINYGGYKVHIALKKL